MQECGKPSWGGNQKGRKVRKKGEIIRIKQCEGKRKGMCRTERRKRRKERERKKKRW